MQRDKEYVKTGKKNPRLLDLYKIRADKINHEKLKRNHFITKTLLKKLLIKAKKTSTRQARIGGIYPFLTRTNFYPVPN